MEPGANLRHAPGDIAGQDVPRLRQSQAARPALEQPLAELLFQRLDMAADGPLRHAQFGSRTHHVAVPGSRLEHVQTPQRQAFWLLDMIGCHSVA
jgi:hypothetical protein